MPKRKHIRFLVLLIILAAAKPVAAQNIDLDDGDTVDYQLCKQGDAVIVSAWSHLVLPIDALARVYANGTVDVDVTMQIGFNGSTSPYPYSDYVNISCGDSLLVDSEIGFNNYHFSNLVGPVEIEVHFDSISTSPVPSNLLRRVYIFVSIHEDSCHTTFWDTRVSDMSTDTAVFYFVCSDSIVLVSVDSGEAVQVHVDSTHNGRAVLRGLTPNSDYTITFASLADSTNLCCQNKIRFHSPPIPALGCFDAADLYAPYTECSYGRIFYNDTSYGIVDSGIYAGSPSRHTVITDTNAYDHTLGQQLKMVCPGCTASVRLGNPRVGSEWESVTYSMTVDTMVNAILILKYAAILENPSHGPNDQPRFSFDLLDNNLQPIGDDCSHALFVAGNSLDWTTIGAVQWKNWTTVGFDLTDFHGQTVNMRFTTADCKQGAHWGYAYYSTECSSKRIHAEHCGLVDSNTFTAPKGFIYRWIAPNGETVSTSRSITLPSDSAIYRCLLTSPENPDCYFTLSAFTGIRIPVAEASVKSITTTDCQENEVTFINSSNVSSIPGERPDEVMWIFSDGDTSYDYSPTHIFHDTGSVTATLIAGLSGWQCTDTITLTIDLPSYLYWPEHLNACDSLTWRDGITYHADTTGVQFIKTIPTGCDSVFTLDLTVNRSYHMPALTDTACRHSYYRWRGHLLFDLSQIDTLLLVDTLTTADGCDSVLSLQLYIKPTVATEPQHDTACMGEMYLWRNIVADNSLSQQMLYDTVIGTDGCDTALALLLTRRPQLHIAIGEDHDCLTATYQLTAIGDTAATLRWSNGSSASTIFASPTSNTTYHLTAGYSDSMLCAVSDSLRLHPIVIPTAMLKVVPARLSYDHPDFTAYDITGEDYLRQWIIVNPDGDSLHLTSDARQITYTADLSDDSLQVVLVVSNGLCPDTAQATVTMLYTTLFAPNVFTPGLDMNNGFAIVGHGLKQLELEIYNRNGECIFRTADAASGWDGTCGGRPCPQGAYVWRLSYIAADRPNTTRTAFGTVTLLR